MFYIAVLWPWFSVGSLCVCVCVAVVGGGGGVKLVYKLSVPEHKV
jgi:hypothetical protein